MKSSTAHLDPVAWLSRAGWRLVVLLVVGVILACSDAPGSPGSQAPPSTPPPVVETIDASGGTVHADGVTLEVPPGALDGPTELRITRLQDAAPSDYRLASAMYRFEPEGLTFKRPVGVAMQFEGPAENLQLFWSNASGGFSAVPGSSPRGQIMHGETLHFSIGFVGRLLENVVAVSKVIGPAGGTLALDEVTLTIPAGALATDATISIRKTSALPPEGVVPVSSIYQFEPADLAFVVEGPRPRVAMNVGAVTDDLAFYWRNSVGDFWALASRAEGGSVVADIRSLSVGFVGRSLPDKLRCAPGTETMLDQFGSSTSVAWNGSGYGVVWTKDVEVPATGNHDLFFARLDANGGKIGGTTKLTSETTSSYAPKLVWRGSEYGLAWFETGEVLRFARLSSNGAILSQTTVTSPGDRPTQSLTLVADASGYALAWTEYANSNTELFFARLTPAGALVAAPQAVTNTPVGTDRPTLVWTGAEYGLAWTERTLPNYRVYFQRMSATGKALGSSIAVTDGTKFATDPAIAWTGSEYGIVWSDSRNVSRELYFARLSSTGTKVGTDVRVTNAPGSRYSPQMTWSKDEYGIAWYDQREGNSYLEVYFARLDSQGTKIGSDARITNGVSASTVNSLVRTTQGYTIGRDLDVPNSVGKSSPTLVTIACPPR